MYCGNCGKQLPEGASFCPNCGQPATGSAPVATMPRQEKKSSAVWIVVVAAVLAAVLWLEPFGSDSERKDGGLFGSAAPTTEERLVGNWSTDSGIGVSFTDDGMFRITGYSLALGGDLLKYEVQSDDVLYLYSDGFGGLGIEAPFSLSGDQLNLELGGLELCLDRER